jgi:hypothetical protein
MGAAHLAKGELCVANKGAAGKQKGAPFAEPAAEGPASQSRQAGAAVNRRLQAMLEPLRGQSIPPPDNRLSSPYLTLHLSWMLCERAFGQLARICRSSGNFASPYCSMSLAML